jgi:phage baseplate assembly protein W
MADGGGDGRAFLGVGPAFPFRLDADGNLAMTSLDEHVRQSIVLILSTDRGERAMRPEFGAGLGRMVFAPVTPATAALIEHEVKTALVRNEPRIEVERVGVRAGDEPSVLLIDITYRVRRTDTVFNLVYPFYVERGLLP